VDDRILIEVVIAAMRRSLSSCLDATRMWRSTERASLEKKPSTRLSQEPCLGVKVNSKRCAGWPASQALVSLEICAEWLSSKAGAGAPSGVDGNGPKRFSVQRKMAVVARLLRGEPLELVSLDRQADRVARACARRRGYSPERTRTR
jgi:hypothetical protein